MTPATLLRAAAKERPILFSAPMIRAILYGSKTQTRRAVNPQPTRVADGLPYGDGPAWAHAEPGSGLMRSRYGVPGDRLWVRETFTSTWFGYPDVPANEREGTTFYRADGLPTWEGEEHEIRWRPSIHMPRWASRITLEVTDVRVERLQAISEADALAEGVKRSQRAVSPSLAVDCFWDYQREQPEYRNARDSYASLWESINGAGSWDANPFVWVVGFKRVAAELRKGAA